MSLLAKRMRNALLTAQQEVQQLNEQERYSHIFQLGETLLKAIDLSNEASHTACMIVKPHHQSSSLSDPAQCEAHTDYMGSTWDVGSNYAQLDPVSANVTPRLCSNLQYGLLEGNKSLMPTTAKLTKHRRQLFFVHIKVLDLFGDQTGLCELVYDASSESWVVVDDANDFDALIVIDQFACTDIPLKLQSLQNYYEQGLITIKGDEQFVLQHAHAICKLVSKRCLVQSSHAASKHHSPITDNWGLQWRLLTKCVQWVTGGVL